MKWKNILEPGWPQICIPCWIPKTTNRHSVHVIFVAFLLQQWLHKRASLLNSYVQYLFYLLSAVQLRIPFSEIWCRVNGQSFVHWHDLMSWNDGIIRGIIFENLDLLTLKRNSLYLTDALSSFSYHQSLTHTTTYYLFNTNLNFILPLIFTSPNSLLTFHQSSIQGRFTRGQ